MSIIQFIFTTPEGAAVLMNISWLLGFFTAIVLRPVKDKQ